MGAVGKCPAVVSRETNWALLASVRHYEEGNKLGAVGKCTAVVSRVMKWALFTIRQLPAAQNDAAPCSAVTAHYVTQQFSPCALSTVTDGPRFESR